MKPDPRIDYNSLLIEDQRRNRLRDDLPYEIQKAIEEDAFMEYLRYIALTNRLGNERRNYPPDAFAMPSGVGRAFPYLDDKYWSLIRRNASDRLNLPRSKTR